MPQVAILWLLNTTIVKKKKLKSKQPLTPYLLAFLLELSRKKKKGKKGR